MSKKIAALFAAAMLANVGMASASDTNVLSDNKTSWGLEARYFSPTFDANVKSDKLKSFNGGSVSLTDDLGMDNGTAPELILKYKNVSIDWVHFSTDGTSNKDITYDGDVYSAGANSDFRLDYVKVKVENDLAKRGAGVLKWNYGITAISLDVSGSGEAYKGGVPQGRKSFDESITLPLPTIGLKYEVPVAKGLGLSLAASGMTAGGYGYFYDLEAGLSYTPAKNLYINAGYRDIKIKAQSDDDEANVELKGPFIGLQYKF